MYTAQNIHMAVHWWSAEYDPDNEVRSLLPFLFENLDALYFATSKFPEKWSNDNMMGIQSGGTHGIYIKMGLPPDMTVLLRSAISITGDIYCIAKRLDSLNAKELNSDIAQLIQVLQKFRVLRNFFAHFDERISNLDVHGITGAQTTNCGITYTDSAKGCFHMAIIGNVFHFSSKGAAEEVDIGKNRFFDVLQAARPIYEKLVSHNIHKEHCNYPSWNEIYA